MLKPAWKGCAGFLMAEMKQNLHCGCLGAKASLDIDSPELARA